MSVLVLSVAIRHIHSFINTTKLTYTQTKLGQWSGHNFREEAESGVIRFCLVARCQAVQTSQGLVWVSERKNFHIKFHNKKETLTFT